MIKKIIIIIIIIIICYNVNKYYKLYETKKFINNNSIYFMTKEETIDFIMKDKDNYIKNMSIYDLYARKVSRHDEYINLIINNCLSFTEEQKNIIKNNNFNNNTFIKIALINNIYEEGFPHTRDNIIFFCPNIINNYNLNKIIKHELIHIKQRFNKKQYKNYIISRKRNTEPLLRANPDLDEYIYKEKNSGLELYYIYSNDKPKGITDIIKINNLEEHPHEIEAYNDYIDT